MQVNRAGAEKTEAGNRNRGKGTEEGAWRHRQEARNRERKQRNRAGAAKTEAGGRKQGQEALSIFVYFHLFGQSDIQNRYKFRCNIFFSNR
jgi:hypothetical protein